MGDTVNSNIVLFNGMRDNTICEMLSQQSVIDVPIDPRIDISTITYDDPDPKFVNVEVIRAGVSGNRRRFNNNIVREIHEMCPGKQGFFGHPDPNKTGFEFREPHSICVGSMIDHMADGLDRCIVKMYLFKTSPLREWIPKSIAAGNPMTVSINGTGDIMRSGDIIDVVHMSDLQSIDWANPGTQGIETSQAMSVVSEMLNNQGGNEMGDVNVNVQDIIKNATVTEFKAFNPNGYNAVLASATVQELQANNERLVQQIIDSNKITELKLTVGGKEESVKITELQGKINTYESKITELQGELETAKISEMKTKLLSDLVPENLRDKIGARVSGKTESELKASIDNEIAYIRELGGNIDNKPIGGKHRELNDDDLKTRMAFTFGHKENK